MKPDSHLYRAKDLLANDADESLLYAALELRLCIESRLLEYSEFAAQYRQNRKSNWRAKDLASHVDGTYAMKPAVYTMELFGDGLPESVVVRYVPVSADTIKILGQCDNFLHALGVRQLKEPNERKRLRDLLTRGISNMEQALTGSMPGPLVRGPDNCITIQIDEDKHPNLAGFMKKGMPITIRIEVTDLMTEAEIQRIETNENGA